MSFYSGVKAALTGMIRTLFRVHMHGTENEPAEGGFLVVSNHISYLDVFVTVMALRHQIRFMAKKELFGIPVLGGIVKALGAFPVDRKGNAVAPLKQSIKLLEAGEVVGMYPQGHRFRKRKFDTTRDEIKGGAAMAVWHAKCPVLPVFIATKNDRVALLRRIDVYIGKPVPFEAFGFEKGGNAEYAAASGVLFEQIAALAPEERRTAALPASSDAPEDKG